MSRSVPTAGVGLAVAAMSAVVAPGSAASAAPLPRSAPVSRPASATPVMAAPGHRAVQPVAAAPALFATPAVVSGTAPEMAYVVVPGDTVSDIARRTGSTIPAIIEVNGLDARALIRVGQVLRIPSPVGSAAPSAAAPQPAASPATHTVVPGDTVYSLARLYGTTVPAIIGANGLRPDALIRVGQQLAIPPAGAPAPTSAPASAPSGPAGTAHVVAPGDTVSALASRYGSTVSAIISANGLGADALIRVGQRLTIPAPGTSTTPAPAPGALVGSTFLGRTYPEPTVAAANANKATLLGLPAPSRAEMQEIIRSTAVSMGVDPALALAVGYRESGFDQRAVSPANAIGAMQVIPSSGVWASQMVGRNLDLLDAHDNATAGVAILRQLVRTSPDLPTAIAGYYQGAGSVRKNGMYPDTQQYVAGILSLMTRYG